MSDVGHRLMRQWLEVVQIASTIDLSDDEDAMIWQFSSSGTYSSQPLYKLIAFRGITPVYVPSIWDLSIPPRVQLFLGNISGGNHNFVKTRANHGKKVV